MAMKVVWAAVLLAYGVSTGAAMDPGASGSTQTFTLDMATTSVDDRYVGCDHRMEGELANNYLQNERNADKDFKFSWDAAVKMYDANYNKKNPVHNDPSAPDLTKDEVIAIYTYTSAPGHFYQPFNEAVRTQGPQYKTTFKFHALHYYLTKAVQHLKVSKCLTVYRRTKVNFRPVKVNSEVRFGSFASSSRFDLNSKMLSADNFGSQTCFEVVTCMGGNVLEYAKFETEAEVLIPPYEKFKVTSVETKSTKPGLPCAVVYKLKSTGASSKYNCALFSK
ncbi:erythroblast NAD(P)(+)--arginine ADP-ribosyltransferase-like [Cyclopterus lumpus]|uniref:erythroblast NAD(P)(+)--arginine ADP-ribosyltransferase-like n=1 Tax=Cyclopterus lumpus TaxID=8103 RepID=UPI0014874015|nr:erythroblast NAD(P)(+)--arginine ADP-ribosyltransferase-like [Cyclopterus lumpus]